MKPIIFVIVPLVIFERMVRWCIGGDGTGKNWRSRMREEEPFEGEREDVFYFFF